jgi:hypothetical protein
VAGRALMASALAMAERVSDSDGLGREHSAIRLLEP